jgi:hypothetical protein
VEERRACPHVGDRRFQQGEEIDMTVRQGGEGVEQAKASPTRAFERPQDVLAANDLSKDDKRRILLEWKDEAIGLQVAADENMGGGENTRLDEVVAALNALDNLDAH